MKADYEANISFATGGFDHVIRMWEPNTGKYLHGFQHKESQVNALAFTKDGHYLAAGGYGRVRVYDVQASAAPLVVNSEFTKNVNTVGFNDSGSWMFAGSEDRMAKIIDWRDSGSLRITRLYQTSSSINSMLLHRNQNELIMSTSKGEVIVWDIRNNVTNSITPEPHGGSIYSLSVNPDATSLAAVNSSGQLFIWSLFSDSFWKLKEKHRCKVHSTYGLHVMFSPDSTLLATCGADGTVTLLKTADFSVVTSQLVAEGFWVWDCAFSADSHFLLTASSDAVARLWSLETTSPLVEYKGHQKAITCMAFRDQSLG